MLFSATFDSCLLHLALLALFSVVFDSCFLHLASLALFSIIFDSCFLHLASLASPLWATGLPLACAHFVIQGLCVPKLVSHVAHGLRAMYVCRHGTLTVRACVSSWHTDWHAGRGPSRPCTRTTCRCSTAMCVVCRPRGPLDPLSLHYHVAQKSSMQEAIINLIGSRGEYHCCMGPEIEM